MLHAARQRVHWLIQEDIRSSKHICTVARKERQGVAGTPEIDLQRRIYDLHKARDSGRSSCVVWRLNRKTEALTEKLQLHHSVQPVRAFFPGKLGFWCFSIFSNFCLRYIVMSICAHVCVGFFPDVFCLLSCRIAVNSRDFS